MSPLQSRSTVRASNARQQTWTFSSDSDLPSDVSVETASHSGCWLIPITLEGVKTLALIGTSASVSMIGRPLYQKIQMHETPRLEGVGENPMPNLGHAEVDVSIRNGACETAVVVNARKKRPNFIIGADFLAAHNWDLSLRPKLFSVGGQVVQCIPEGVRANNAKLKIARHIELPPQSESEAVRLPKVLRILGRPVLWHTQLRIVRCMLRPRSSLTAPTSETHYLPVINLLFTSVKRTLYSV